MNVRPGKNEWRTGPDETLVVVNPKSKKVKVRSNRPFAVVSMPINYLLGPRMHTWDLQDGVANHWDHKT